ncbi:MAG: hypothetical protein LIQ31_14810 [Planctomycetes bacterium]|nr:hypothetical protein [Planctomycetota bacterium]
MHIPDSTGGYGGGYGTGTGPAVRIPDTSVGYGSGYGQEGGSVRSPGAASGYDSGPIRIPGFPVGPGTGPTGSSGTIHIPDQTTGYGDRPSGSVRIPTETRGYGAGSAGSGTIHIPEHTAGYGERPSGTVIIPEQTGGYGESSGGTVRIPGATQGYGGSRTSPFDSGPAVNGTGPHHRDRDAERYVVRDISVVDINTGRLLHLGDVDLRPTLDRIRRGEKADHRNDGAVFQNRERNLPRKPRGYYREYVVPTPGVRGVGPQRLVLGDGGEVYYSHDHYDSFQRVE